MICKKCWDDAALRYALDHSKALHEHYNDLIDEREDNPCSQEEQGAIAAVVLLEQDE